MTRKAFFAAFVIDEASYTPEPGTVDRHFVVADLAQSSFGEQPGVSNFIVWESVEDLIRDHRERGPITAAYLTEDETLPAKSLAATLQTCPSNHWNAGDDHCADCGEDLNPFDLKDCSATSDNGLDSLFRAHLPPGIRDSLAFEHYEVRPCIEQDNRVISFRDEEEYQAELARAGESGREFRTFWSLYGVDSSQATTIGDFVSKNKAHEVMNAILAIPAATRNAINAKRPARYKECPPIEKAARAVADWMDDMINQSSHADRI